MTEFREHLLSNRIDRLDKAVSRLEIGLIIAVTVTLCVGIACITEVLI